MTKADSLPLPWWRQDQILPMHTGQNWAIWKGRPIECQGEEEVAKTLRSWNPLQTVLVAEPGATHFVPPPQIPKLRAAIDDFRKRTRRGLLALLAASALFAGIAFTAPHKGSAPIYLITLMITLITSLDYAGYLRHEGPLTERARFFYWLQTSSAPRIGFAVWTAIGLGMGAVQLGAQHSLGGLEGLIRTYGLFYDSAASGEYWRYITGPFFHASIGHYLNNLFSLLFIGVIAWATLGVSSIAVFIMGNSISAVAEMYLGNAAFDSYLGVSGGVFALYGFVATSGLLRPNTYPKGFALLCAYIALITAIGSELVSSMTGSASHIAGFVVGALLGVVWARSSRAGP